MHGKCKICALAPSDGEDPKVTFGILTRLQTYDFAEEDDLFNFQNLNGIPSLTGISPIMKLRQVLFDV